MGRPLKQKFFDPRPDTPADGSSRVLIGGEGVGTGNATVTFGNVGLGYYSANVAATFSAPQLPGGVTAVAGAITLWANGAIQAVSVSNAGTGYTSAPTLTFTGANTYPATGTAAITSTVTNVIATSAWIPTVNGGSSAVVGDIVKQVGARRYKVTTAQGTGKCKLVTEVPTAGTMTIAATDSKNSTYYVKKLDERLVTLVQNTDGGSGFDYDTGEKAKWSLTGSASAPSASDIGTVLISSN
jgi:hypothetical protein